MTAEGTFLDASAWYARLPALHAAAGALITDETGCPLLVKPNYRDHWSIPGGILEHGEPPHAGCAREVTEELGIAFTPGDLLAVDWVPPEGDRPRPFVYFVFDGGVLADARVIRLQAAELDAFRFTRPGDLHRFLPPVLTARVSGALAARSRGCPIYLPAAQPAS